eukprot:6075086-Pyramimonas_sp.AAC.1
MTPQSNTCAALQCQRCVAAICTAMLQWHAAVLWFPCYRFQSGRAVTQLGVCMGSAMSAARGATHGAAPCCARCACSPSCRAVAC